MVNPASAIRTGAQIAKAKQSRIARSRPHATVSCTVQPRVRILEAERLSLTTLKEYSDALASTGSLGCLGVSDCRARARADTSPEPAHQTVHPEPGSGNTSHQACGSWRDHGGS